MPERDKSGLDSIDILAQTAFFSGLSARQLSLVAKLCRPVSFPQECSIYNLGDQADDFYILVHGMVRFTIGLGGRSTSAGEIIRRGEVFGWAALIEGAQTRSATAFCLTPCTVLAINGNRLLELMEQDNTMGYRIMKQLNFLINGKLTAFAAG